MAYRIPGTFLARDLGHGVWRLTQAAPGTAEVYLQGGAKLADVLQHAGTQGANLAAVDLEWRDGCVAVTVTGAAGIRRLEASSAIVHEPRDRLYDNLPLARFDSDAIRFWQRVFRLMRIPGGRLLLGFIARRNR